MRLFGLHLAGFVGVALAVVIANSELQPAQGQDTTAKLSAQDAQALLDQATDLKIEADTPDELGKVIELAEKALTGGLDKENEGLAKQLIASSALQRAQSMVQQMLQARNRNPAAVGRMRTNIRRDLKKSIEADPKMVDAILLLAQIEEPAEAKKQLELATQLLQGDKEKLSKVYMMKGALAQEMEDKLVEFRKAVEIDPENLEARQAVITIQVATGKFDEAYTDAKSFLEKEPKNIFAIKAAVAALKELGKSDEAIALLTSKIEEVADPNVLLADRAELYVDQATEKKDDSDTILAKAVEDLSKVVEADPKNGQALMTRSRVYLQLKQYDKAEQDIEDVLALQPNQPGALYFRSIVAANQKRLGDAISDLQQVVRLIPNNAEFLLQLGSYYQMDDRPKKAIQVADEIVKSENEEWADFKTRALRLRGDARLSIGEHTAAIADFEKAIELLSKVGLEDKEEEKAEKSGLLNNLAWVLATSPVDAIRNGKRAVELGTQACELTEFKAAHILSTLAAAYAEVGQFDEALKWAEKAVEEGKKEGTEQLKQLQEELDSYKVKKPWREKQETKEKKAPIPSPDGVDT